VADAISLLWSCLDRLGTIRRFLERFGNGIDAVVLCVTEEPDIKAYQVLLPQYFPRNAEELEHSRRYLPEDVGTAATALQAGRIKPAFP